MLPVLVCCSSRSTANNCTKSPLCGLFFRVELCAGTDLFAWCILQRGSEPLCRALALLYDPPFRALALLRESSCCTSHLVARIILLCEPHFALKCIAFLREGQVVPQTPLNCIKGLKRRCLLIVFAAFFCGFRYVSNQNAKICARFNPRKSCFLCAADTFQGEMWQSRSR